VQPLRCNADDRIVTCSGCLIVFRIIFLSLFALIRLLWDIALPNQKHCFWKLIIYKLTYLHPCTRNNVTVYLHAFRYAYCSTDDGKTITLGKQKSRPTYQDIAAMLENKGVAYKWARTAGLGNKFE
jgi:hypothetical protein